MKIRKILVMALALTFVNGVTAPFAAEMPCHSFAANVEDTDDIGKLGDNVTWSLNDEGTLTISGKGDISDYTDGDTPFANNEQIKKVIIEEGITHIGNYVFSSCHNIQSIELPESLTGIGEYVFENCTSLTNIDIPDSVTSIGQYAFSGTAVKSIVIPESVITLDTNSMFMDCRQLESVVLPQSVTAIYSNAFKNCIKLKEVDIPDSVTAIQNRNTKKAKFAIQTEGSDRTYIAGLYRYEEHSGMQVPMFSILTREAAGSVKDIHDRMPLILDKDNVKNWIRPNGDPSAIVEKALSNMVFDRAVEYPRFPPEIITA